METEISRDAPAEEFLGRAVDRFGSGLVVSSSFGIQSAVLIHMISRVAPATPVIWIDTGYLPPETYRYAAALSARFSLNLKVYQSQYSPARMEALFGRLWESEHQDDLDRYHALRKIEPMHRALRELRATAWVSGIRSAQTTHRRTLRRVEAYGEITKIHPILYWTDEDVTRYLTDQNLPPHPLAAQGYHTVGDVHLSKPADASARDRETRFNGRMEECGIHLPPSNHIFSFGGSTDALHAYVSGNGN